MSDPDDSQTRNDENLPAGVDSATTYPELVDTLGGDDAEAAADAEIETEDSEGLGDQL